MYLRRHNTVKELNYQNYKRPHPILSMEIKTNTEA